MGKDERPLLSRTDALSQGYTDDELRRFCASGRLVRVRAGVYGLPRLIAELDAVAKHRLAVHATIAALDSRAAISHASAAVMWDLPLWATSLRLVHLTISKSSGGGKSNRRHVHCAPFDDDEVTTVGELLVSTVVRTVVDLARTLPFEQAVVVGDAAMRKYNVTTAELLGALDRWPRRPGAVAARRAIEFMDGRSESVGESRSRVRFYLAGITPDLQFDVHDEAGKFLGRTDFCDDDAGVLGEFDGESKYGRLLLPGQDPGSVVFDEKVREDTLRETGAEVVRWIWKELDEFAVVEARWRRALARARSAPTPRWRR
ncbi:type IV toxin-antitoxin system AbiEi family antitoxin domain-containing protein [Antrihabitans stalactiti]|uniref:Type IV toxin-antitoxin system AbiEi family antitoxin domain-containing protein n=1 Tax=Antrihabitans stalactiti TaxID=2584121 RepID=A0A848KCU7_9NOCA|nr:type IV toxin-antitoxin system AbiEi family antitoxin domain-containing protein [Antrihabitans stalactiti]NMN94512.1 type IV toxin-antitoxin system AbiEi family antitoxin domain-containing protein [Antrihabitans stalactiti]